MSDGGRLSGSGTSDREEVAKAMYEVSPELTDCDDTLDGLAAADPIPWNDLHDLDREGWRRRADAALVASGQTAVLKAFVEWFDARFPAGGKNLPGVTLFGIAKKARELTDA